MKKFALLSMISVALVLSTINGQADGTRVPENAPPAVVFSGRGIVARDKVNIRARPDKNSEVIAQLKRGDTVEIRDRKGEWLRIAAPEGTKCYVSSKYIKNGVVTGDAIHVRCGAGTNFKDIGKVTKGEKLDLVSSKGGWAEIKPTADCSGWVNAELISVGTQGPAPAPIITSEPIVSAPLSPPVVTPPPAPVKVAEDTDEIHIQYVVKDGILAVSKEANAPGAYALMTDDVDGRQYIIAYLDSPQTNLTRYDGKHVRILGTQKWKRTERYPVITVERCEMVW